MVTLFYLLISILMFTISPEIGERLTETVNQGLNTSMDGFVIWLIGLVIVYFIID